MVFVGKNDSTFRDRLDTYQPHIPDGNVEPNRLGPYVYKSCLTHKPRQLRHAVAPVVHHQRIVVARVAVEPPIGVLRGHVRHIKQLQNLVQARALNRQLATGLEQPHPLLHHREGFPRLEVFDHMDRPGLVRALIRQRDVPQVAGNVWIGAKVRAFQFSRYGVVNAGPTVFPLVSAPKVEANRLPHWEPIAFGLNRSRI